MGITMFYSGLLALVFLVLSVRVIQGRTGPNGPGLGDGGDPSMLRRIRGHANFAEYVPLILLMIAFIEYSGASRLLVHGLGAALVLARVLHGGALSFTQKWKFGRFWGALLTLVLLLVCGLLCLWTGAQSL